MGLHKLIFDTTDATTRSDSHTVGAVLYDAVNDRLAVINVSQELEVHDTDANASLDNIESDTAAMVIDLAAIEVEQLAQGVTLDSILVDTSAISVDTGVIAGDTASIDSILTALSKAEDAAHVSGDQGIMGLAVRNDSEGTLVGADGDYAPLQVDNVGRLRVIADLDFTVGAEEAEDDAHVSGDTGNYVLGVRQDSLASSTSADGDYASFKQNAKGEQYIIDTDGNALLTTIDGVLDNILTDTNAMVVDLAAIEVEQLAQGVTLDSILVDTGVIASDTTSIDSTLTALSKSEDAVHASGDQGIMGLAVRNDTLAALADTDGDYAPFQVDATGALYVAIASIDDAALADSEIATAENPLTAGNTAEDVVVSPLSNRKYLTIYNNGNKTVYIGASGVSAASGFPIPNGSLLEMRAGPSVDIEWVAVDTNQKIRTLELS